jgi:protocatechuate 3,4-dioxygenase beta subunit
MNGKPIQDVKIDIWETDSSGHYDVQVLDGMGGGEAFSEVDQRVRREEWGRVLG